MGKFLLRTVCCVIMLVPASDAAPLRPFAGAPQWTIDELCEINDRIPLGDWHELPVCYPQKIHICKPTTRYEMAIFTARILEKFSSCKPGKTSFECKIQIRLHRRNFTISNEELDDLVISIRKLVVEFKEFFTILGMEPFYKFSEFPMGKKQSFPLNTSKFFLLNLKTHTHHSH